MDDDFEAVYRRHLEIALEAFRRPAARPRRRPAGARAVAASARGD
jgi:hypothetical protein